MRLLFLSFLCFLLIVSCKTTKIAPVKPVPVKTVPVVAVDVDTVKPAPVKPIDKVTKTDPFLLNLLQTKDSTFNFIVANRENLQVQVIYTRIDRQADNTPVFQPFYFNVNPQKYFYPASTVKMPVALLALQRLNELKVVGLNSHSTMITEKGFSGQTPVYNDATSPDGRPSVAHYIKKIFLTSDNDAFNRLYEFLGPGYINARLHKMGYENTEIIHRLSIALTEEENRHTNPQTFLNETGKFLYNQPSQVHTDAYPVRNDLVGERYYADNALRNEPMDFSKKNRIGLEALTEILKSTMFPEAAAEKKRFNIRPEDYPFVWKYMSQLPSETSYPAYDSTVYWDAYVKFLLYGSEKDTMPKGIRIFNKVGNAYGFLTDVAYIVDFDHNIEFMLSASIYCNSDGTLNDDQYDYKTIGLPFMKNLGKLIYDAELQRERRHPPDLSRFKIKYDK